MNKKSTNWLVGGARDIKAFHFLTADKNRIKRNCHYMQFDEVCNKVITIMVIRPLDDST